jgi:hypothetical protein
MDYSCQTDDDCVVKDIHNCCGCYPACTNVNSNTNPKFVKEICERDELVSGCGYPVMESCSCVDK